MENHWQLQQAKNQFSEVVNEALRHGPQIVTRHGIETVVILSTQDYQRLSAPKGGLVDFFQQSPLQGAVLDLERSRDTGRDVDL